MELSYCTNVHPAEDLDGVLDQLDAFAGPGAPRGRPRPARRGPLAPGRARGAGSRRARTTGAACARARGERPRAAHDQRLPVPRVPRRGREARRLPSRLDRRRAGSPTPSTARAVLADLLPEGGAGSISTLPLGWREPWTPADDRARDRGRSRRLAPSCARCATRPAAPCGSRSNPSRAACSTPSTTWSDGSPRARARAVHRSRVRRRLPRHLPPRGVVRRSGGRRAPDRRCRPAGREGAGVGGAPRGATRPTRSAATRSRASSSRATCTRPASSRADGVVLAADDLPEALDSLPADGPWRVHFHVPLHLGADARRSRRRPTCWWPRSTPSASIPHGDEAHLDVETYTWTVLPGRRRRPRRRASPGRCAGPPRAGRSATAARPPRSGRPLHASEVPS